MCDNEFRTLLSMLWVNCGTHGHTNFVLRQGGFEKCRLNFLPMPIGAR
jgi:hypothetical protein